MRYLRAWILRWLRVNARRFDAPSMAKQRAEVPLQHLDERTHSFGPVRRKRPHDRATEKYALRAKDQRDEDIGRTAETSIHQDREIASDGALDR